MVKELETNDFSKLVENGFTFVDFYALWCNPCMMMAPVVEEVSEEIKEINFIKVNVDKYPDLAMTYRIQSIPRFVIFKDGIMFKATVGAMSKEDLVCFIKDSIK